MIDLESGESVLSLPNRRFFSAEFDPDGSFPGGRYLVASDQFSVEAWDPRTGESIGRFERSDLTRGEVEDLKSRGLSDRDILDVVRSVAARAFFTTIIDALDSPVEEELIKDLEPELLELLVVGRPLQPT